MARDFEDIRDIDDLSDDDLRDVVRDRIADDSALDADDISVEVQDGVVRLVGRVGTAAARRIAEHIVTDALGVEHAENDLVVDPIRRAISPEAADDHDADDEDRRGRLLGDRAVPFSAEAEHGTEDLDGGLFGTHDLQASLEHGIPWEPPAGPTPEGLERGSGENH
ncbi:MAG: hypothetical protein NVS9B3_15400 [Gemmatimonadaceae bacterium]